MYLKTKGAILAARPGIPLEYDEETISSLMNHQLLEDLFGCRSLTWRQKDQLLVDVGAVSIGQFKLVPPDQVAIILRRLNQLAS